MPLPFRRLAIHTLSPDTRLDMLLGWAAYALDYGADAFLIRRQGLAEDPIADLVNKQAFVSELKTTHPERFVILEIQSMPSTELNANGYHVKSGVELQPQPGMFWSKASHSIEELKLAEQAGFSAATLSPIFETQSHPGAPALGLEYLNEAAESTALPIIALGGIQPNRVYDCLKHGAAAVAGMGCFR